MQKESDELSQSIKTLSGVGEKTATLFNQININSDLSIPVCCTVWERGENIVAKNYLDTNLNEINLNKSKVDTCNKCMDLKLPEYNMGFNKEGWRKYANQKTITDIGEK